MAALYFSIRIWGAPATLIGFVGTGFLVGMGRSKTLLALQLFLNGLNVVLDILLAGIMGLGAAGIALGTVISEWCAVLLGASSAQGAARDEFGGRIFLALGENTG